MDKVENCGKESTVEILNVISKLVQDFEKKVVLSNVKAKECEELKLLKNKCCDENPIVSLTGFHGIEDLVKRKIFIGSQTVSMLVSLLPSINQYQALVSTIGNILVMDLKTQLSEKGDYESPYSFHILHPLVIVLKYNWEKSWFEIYHFVLQLMQNNEDIKLEHKVKFLRPILQEVFGSSRRDSQFQLKLFNFLMMKSEEKKIIKIILEILLWQEIDIYYCLLLQDFFIHLLKENHEEHKIIISGMTPALAHAIKWLILNGCNPGKWLEILRASIKLDPASGSTVLFILTDVIMETPSVYINAVVDVCKSIIFSSNCSKYVAYKFVAVILNWFVNPSFLANPVYKTLEEILEFITGETNKWTDQTDKLNNNEYYKNFGHYKTEIKFAVDLILASGCWTEQKTYIENWLRNLIDSNEQKMLLRLHSFIYGIILCVKDMSVINLCLDLLFKLIDRHKEISFSLLCLMFYKLGRETEPNMQKIYLFSLPKLYTKKENIPLIVGIIESLKRGSSKVMTPLIIQLYLSLWKFDPRTYSYLHKMLHDNDSSDVAWEVNVSKAIALKEICRLVPHLYAKDLVGVLSRILNECSNSDSGLPSAFAIEAVTDLCKAYVIDVEGTWNAIQPKLRVDKRPEVISSLCKFFGDIPNLKSSGQKNEELIKDIVSMLWNYTFFKDLEVVKNAFRALSKFPIENLTLKCLPEIYRVNIKMPKDLDKDSKTEDLLNLSYVPAECWVQFLRKIDEEVLHYGGDLIIAFIERELTSMPRGLFYLASEKSEPLNYSYLPPRSICRYFVEHLQKRLKECPTSVPAYIKEIIRILSHGYSKLLPPLNWGFCKNLMELGSDYLRHCLALLAKQGCVSVSAKSILENYFVSVEWNYNTLDDILFIYNLLPLLCKDLSYDILQKLLEQTIQLCLETSLNKNTSHFKEILQNLTEALRNKSVQPSQRKLIARQLEKVLILIPPEQEVMKDYANCATEFPVQSVEEITSIKNLNEIDSFWFRRAVTIRSAIAMRLDIKNPLVWLNEFTEISARFPNEQNFILSIILRIIRNRRDCDHRSWLQELTWRILALFTTSTSQYSNKVMLLFLVDVFIAVIIILSGYDCLFVNIDEFTTNKSKKLEIFPHALSFLFSFPDWSDMLPKMGSWLQKLSERKDLLEDRAEAFVQALFVLRIVKWTLS